MDVKPLIRAILDSTGWQQHELAARLKVKQPTISRWMSGAEPRYDKIRKIEALAAKLGIAFSDGVHHNNGHLVTVPLVGVVEAGNTLVLYADGQGPLGEVEAPPNATRSTVAVEVRGDSMRGIAENGWIVYYDDRREPVTDDLLGGRICIVGLADGRVLVKKLQRGSGPNRFHLYSESAEPLFDQEVSWAAKVTWIKPI